MTKTPYVQFMKRHGGRPAFRKPTTMFRVCIIVEIEAADFDDAFQQAMRLDDTAIVESITEIEVPSQ